MRFRCSISEWPVHSRFGTKYFPKYGLVTIVSHIIGRERNCESQRLKIKLQNEMETC